VIDEWSPNSRTEQNRVSKQSVPHKNSASWVWAHGAANQ
jgi:hypothetical protein